jgi:4-aminobutyrate aminotransferase-like enzyme
MIMEPIQVSEGIHPAGPAFLQQAVDIARSFGIIVIFDEIYTGFGRVGAKFYCDRTGIIPDLLMIGKGLGNGVPISAVLGSSAIMNAMPPGHHSSTFAANPLSCAAGTAVLDVMNETSIWNNAEKVGSQLMHSLERLRQSSGIISKPRGEGLLIGFDMLDNEGNASPAKARLFADLAMDRGILLRWGGYSGSTIKVTPPLTMNQAELDFLSSSFTDIADVIQAKEN